MKSKHSTYAYALLWTLVIALLGSLIVQMYGDARIMNYSGTVRGCTQRLVKSELNALPNDELITYIDEIIHELQTGEGEHSLRKETNADYQAQLETVNETWITLKKTIIAHRTGFKSDQFLFTLSELHYEQSDKLVSIAERVSTQKVIRFVAFYLSSTLIGFSTIMFIGKRVRKKMEASRITDPLTGTLLPRVFISQTQALLQQDKESTHVAIAFDIEKFKDINLNYGYNDADALLYAIANELIEYPSPTFLVSHITADVFFALTKYQDNIEALLQCVFADVVKKAQQKQNLPFEEIGFRFGCCIVEQNPDAVQTAMDRAHRANKIASVEKKSFVWCDENLLVQLKREAYIAKNFFRALDQKEFQMYLQPQMNVNTRTVDSAESLVRWKLPNGELLFPDEFIPFLEQKKLIPKLDYYMLNQVCAYQQNRLNNGCALYTIAVNFSRVTLTCPEFYQTVLDTVAHYHVPPERIGIEIVETALNNLSDASLVQLSTLKNLGFRIAIDDFGSGYSNLSQLCDLPVHVLKLDKEFLWHVKDNNDMHHVMISIIDMAHKIGLKIICEGAETQEHIDFLHAVGCDCIQGYFYSKPVPKEDYHW